MTQSHTAGEPGAHPSVASPAVSTGLTLAPGVDPAPVCSVFCAPGRQRAPSCQVDVQVVTQAPSPTKKQGSKVGGKRACLPGGPEDAGGHAGMPRIPWVGM